MFLSVLHVLLVKCHTHLCGSHLGEAYQVFWMQCHLRRHSRIPGTLHERWTRRWLRIRLWWGTLRLCPCRSFPGLLQRFLGLNAKYHIIIAHLNYESKMLTISNQFVVRLMVCREPVYQDQPLHCQQKYSGHSHWNFKWWKWGGFTRVQYTT